MWEGFIVSRTTYAPKLNFYITANKWKLNLKVKSSIFKEHKILRNKFNKTHSGLLPENYTILLKGATEYLNKWEDVP